MPLFVHSAISYEGVPLPIADFRELETRWYTDAITEHLPVVIGEIVLQSNDLRTELLTLPYGPLGTHWKAEVEYDFNADRVNNVRESRNQKFSDQGLAVVDEYTDSFLELITADVSRIGIAAPSVDLYVAGGNYAIRNSDSPHYARQMHIDGGLHGSRYVFSDGPTTEFADGPFRKSRRDESVSDRQAGIFHPSGAVVRFCALTPHQAPESDSVARLFMTGTVNYATAPQQ
jgi:hypothetical protein